MKKFFGEFKKFITRGNVLDMSVGVIVGGAFTAIVNGLSNFILKPIINWLLALILGANSLDSIYTFLKVAYEEGTTTIDLANSIYIDWGAFINAIINFLLIAFVLFTIVRVINNMKEGNSKFKDTMGKLYLNKAERKELKQAGIKLRDREAIRAFYAEKERLEKEKEEQEKIAQEEQAKADRLANPTTEDLLKEIRDLLKNKA